MSRARGGSVQQRVAQHSRYKTAFELMEEVENRKQMMAEVAAEEKAREEARARRWAWVGVLKDKLNVFKKSDFEKAMIAMFSDIDGVLKERLQYLHITSKAEKKSWLTMWMEIDGDCNNKMSYREFISFFNMSEDIWTRRVFDIMNHSITGVVTFVELIKFCAAYLTVDQDTTIEFSFRMISRRGSMFKPKVSILDLEDIRIYVQRRYRMTDQVKIRKRALDIFTCMDTDGDGGLTLDEYKDFCKSNPVFVKFTHHFQQHLRKCIFGIKYWVEKSRKIRVSHRSASDLLTLESRMNHKSETYTVLHLGDPVVDERGRPIVNPRYVSEKANALDAVNAGDQNEANCLVLPTTIKGVEIPEDLMEGILNKHGSKHPSAPPTAANAAAAPKIDGKAAGSGDPPTSLLPPIAPAAKAPKPPMKSTLAWHGPFAASAYVSFFSII